MKQQIIRKGTIVKLNGVPFELMNDTSVFGKTDVDFAQNQMQPAKGEAKIHD